jgi:hypothetical protein
MISIGYYTRSEAILVLLLERVRDDIKMPQVNAANEGHL